MVKLFLAMLAALFPSTPATTVPTPPPLTSPSPLPTPGLSQWFYPQATMVEQSATGLRLSSTDDPKTITAWYKRHLEQAGWRQKTTVQTTVNGTTANTMVGVTDEYEVAVEISRNAFSRLTTIEVLFRRKS